MDPRTDMASQVSSMVSPGWTVGSNIQRLCSFGGSDPFQSGGGPCTMVLRKIQVDMLAPLTNAQRPEATNPPGAGSVFPPGMAAWEINAPFWTTS